MNGYTIITLIIILLITACIMPTLDSRYETLQHQADDRVERLKNMGRM
jgi:hypothetical protein